MHTLKHTITITGISCKRVICGVMFGSFLLIVFLLSATPH